MTSSFEEFETTERPTIGATEVRGVVCVTECSELCYFIHFQTKVLMISQFLSYIFTIFVNNLVVSVQVRGGGEFEDYQPKGPNRTSERANSLE